jgi:uncharacterized protein YjbJ (UPF0337 family)
MTKLSTNDMATGKLHEVKGAIRQQVGKITENPDLEADGQAEKIVGKVQILAGKIEKKIGA